MKKAIKWIAIVVGGLIVLIIAALLIIPMFVDMQQYKPQIEEKVATATGRSFKLGGDISLSLFPWAGLSLSDLHLGNPSGFQEEDLLSVKSFEVRVKLLPLLTKSLQVKRFILDGARIVLETSKDGRRGWEGLGKAAAEKPAAPPQKKPEAEKGSPSLSLKELAVGEFAITNSSMLWLDHAQGERKELSDVTFSVKDVSLDRPVTFALSANLDGLPLSMDGNVGPLGKEPGRGTIPVDLSVKALKELDINVKGTLTNPAERPAFDLAVSVSPFSPRKVMAALQKPFPMTTADPKALDRVAFNTTARGTTDQVAISDGVLTLDDSTLTFSMKAKEFDRPDVAFDLNLDKIDLDRYLPPAEKERAQEKKAAEKPEPKKKTDYAPMRRAVVDGTVRVAEIKAHGAKMQDLYLKVLGRNGVFNLDPLSAKLYEGTLAGNGTMDVRQDVPKTAMTLDLQGLQAGPLLRDVMKKDFLEGTAKATMAIRMEGDEGAQIKKTLNGKGDFLFKDGAVKGIDVANMVRNVQAAFGLAEKGGEKPRTDFAELHAPFTITNGLVNTPNTTLMSPLLRVAAVGDANLVTEVLNMRVEPKVVGTIKGQDDTMERGGVMVPVLVTGTFSEPKFRPDLEGLMKQQLQKEIPAPSELKKLIPGAGTQEEQPTPVEDKVKGLLKGFGK